MGFWNNLDLLNRVVFWLTIATVAAPFAFGIAALVLQTRARKLDDERVDRLQQANETLKRDLQSSMHRASEAALAAQRANARIEAEAQTKRDADARRRIPPLLDVEMRSADGHQVVVLFKSLNLIPFEVSDTVVTSNDQIVSGISLDWTPVFPTNDRTVFSRKSAIQWERVRDSYLELRVRYRSRAPDSRDLPGHAGMIVKKYRIGADGQLTGAP